MKKEEIILAEIEKIKHKYYRGVPCGKKHNHYYYDENKKLSQKEIPCDFINLCGKCKSLLTQRIERQLIKQLNWVLED